ncbi:MAG: DUF503 domain-containing protein [Anaerolineales bacterium]|jgi:uncharacterized protein YlxP (DUF503 family)|nr:DUF503 domain-containing protein [Anaerolineales bacterium]
MIATLTFHLHIPACASLKEKRRRIKPLISRLRREFNVSVAEVGLNDKWSETLIGCAMIGNDAAFLQSALETVRRWLEAHWTDGDVWDVKVEIGY